MQEELIEMLDKMVKYFDELPSDSYYYRETVAILDEAEKLVEKAKNSAKESAVPQGWQVERKSDYRIRVQSPSGEAWSFEHVNDRGSSNLFVYQMLDAMLAAAPSQEVRGMPDVATWLWLRFADYCRKQGMNPHHQNDLFAIVNDLRAMLASTTPPVQAASQPVTLTEAEIISVKKASKASDPTKPWGDSIAFAEDIIAALREKEGK